MVRSKHNNTGEGGEIEREKTYKIILLSESHIPLHFPWSGPQIEVSNFIQCAAVYTQCESALCLCLSFIIRSRILKFPDLVSHGLSELSSTY